MKTGKLFAVLTSAMLLLLLFTFGAGAADNDNVAFLATGGTGDGRTPDAPVGRLTEAMDLLDLDRDGTIVLVGEFVQSNFYAYKEEFSGSVTITSVWDGVDYRERGAKYTSTPQRFICSGEYIFKDMTFHLTGDYYFIIANHYPVTIDSGVAVETESPKLDGKSIITGFSILGGYQNEQACTLGGAVPPASGSDPVNITVRSGSKIAICAYSRAIASTDFSGEAIITVEGDADVGQIYYAQVNGASAGHGDVTINVRENAHVARISGSDKPGPMQRFVLNWESGTIDEFARSAEDTAAEGFTLNYGAAVAKTIPFAVISPSFDSKNPLASDAKFAASRTYANQFTDVAANQWFYPFVKTAFEYTLANGTSDTKFSPDGKFTVAQALTAAVNIHKAYNGTTVRAAAAGEAWYVPYVEYCVQNGIIKDGQFANLDAYIKRGDMAIVFANILPESEYKAIREKALPDMTADMPSAAAVRKLANAGIVGGDAKGNFNPANEITRAEACVIFTRIAVADMRDAK